MLRTMRGTVAAAQEAQEKNVLGAETARIDIQSSLGAPGTYDLPSLTGGTGASTGVATGGGNPLDPNTGGLLKKQKATSYWATQGLGGDSVQDITTLDPDAISKRHKSSAEFRIRSRMTAESEQLLARQGELYDRFVKNQVAPVQEALGAFSREAAAERKKMMARGGAARRQSFAMESELREKEKIASERATQISNIYTRIDDYSRKYAEDTLRGNAEWVNNLGGIRDDHVRLANEVQKSMMQDAVPTMFQLESAQHQVRAAAHSAKRQKTMGIAKMAMAAVAAYFGQGQMAAGLASSAMDSFSAGNTLRANALANATTGNTPVDASQAREGASDFGGMLGAVGGGLFEAMNAKKNQQQLNSINSSSSQAAAAGVS